MLCIWLDWFVVRFDSGFYLLFHLILYIFGASRTHIKTKNIKFTLNLCPIPLGSPHAPKFPKTWPCKRDGVLSWLIIINLRIVCTEISVQCLFRQFQSVSYRSISLIVASTHCSFTGCLLVRNTLVLFMCVLHSKRTYTLNIYILLISNYRVEGRLFLAAHSLHKRCHTIIPFIEFIHI